ncbi:MAG: class I SAM-dependent methyltransferase [Candidatus Omnitrophica bacterium]|nr:class I SAM-dependent methyltransferase [Candidatus Omnitrophota bacterium]
MTIQNKIQIKYYGTSDDPMWQMEVEKLFPWIGGKGADIGCGLRTIDDKIIRVDIDEKVQPEVLASGDKLPFKNGDLDFITSIHNFEHYPNQKEVLTEWLRVLKVGGIVAIVHPDIDHTKKQNPEIDNPGLKANPFNRHYHEHNPASFIKEIKKWADLPFQIVDYGPACINWSFYVILKKTERS